MRRARQIELPPEPIPFDTAKELQQHAYNSALWYATNTVKSAHEVLEKLHMKGFPKIPSVITGSDGAVRQVNFASAAVRRLERQGLIDDELVADSLTRTHLSSGHGASRIRMELARRGVSEKIAGEATSGELFREKEEAALRKTAGSLLRMPSYRKLDGLKRRQKAMKTLLSRGFAYQDIVTVLDEEEAGHGEPVAF